MTFDYFKLVLWLVLLYQAYLWAAGPKLTILYLRRFRLTSAQAVVTAALEKGLSKRYRVITLDDASFPAMEVPLIYKRLSRYGGPFLWLMFIVIIIVILTMLEMQSNPTFTGWIPAMGYIAIMMIIGPILVSLSVIIVILMVALLLQRWRVRKRAKVTVQSNDDVDKVKATIANLGCWYMRSTLLAPRATIVTVIDDLWQKVVVTLVNSSHVVLVDISNSTENLQWELALLEKYSFQNTVFVANRESTPIIDLPVGQSCVYYENFSKRHDWKVFLNALTQALDERTKPPTPFQYRNGIIQPVFTSLRTLFVLTIAMILTMDIVVMLLSNLSGASAG